MKQPQYEPLQVWEMALDAVRGEQRLLRRHRREEGAGRGKGLRAFIKDKHAALVERIESTKDLSKEDEATLHEAVKDFKKNGTY